MSNIGSYTSRSFSENQKFLVLDPSTGTTSLVLGSDLVSYITPQLNAVNAESTRLAAENTDYAVGEVIQTTGATSPGDNFAAVYLVVEGGTGDFPMINGNDLLVIRGDEFLREQLIQNTAGVGSDLLSHTGTNDTVTEALDKRTIYVGSVADGISGLTGVDGRAYNVIGWHVGSEIGGGEFVFRAGVAKSQHNGGSIISPTVPAMSAQAGTTGAEKRDNYLAGAGETDALGSGVFVKRVGGQVDITEYGAFVDNTGDDYGAAFKALAIHGQVTHQSGVSRVDVTNADLTMPDGRILSGVGTFNIENTSATRRTGIVLSKNSEIKGVLIFAFNQPQTFTDNTSLTNVDADPMASFTFNEQLIGLSMAENTRARGVAISRMWRGITTSGVKKISVKDCKILQNSEWQTQFFNSVNVEFSGNTVMYGGASGGAAFSSSKKLTIVGNYIKVPGTGINPGGSSAAGFNVEDVVISGNTIIARDCINLENGAVRYAITGNHCLVLKDSNLAGTNGIGIGNTSNSGGTFAGNCGFGTITGNMIDTYDAEYSTGIVVGSDASDAAITEHYVISGNTIAAAQIGIHARSGNDAAFLRNITVSNNTLRVGNRGILFARVRKGQIFQNTIVSRSSTVIAGYYGISLLNYDDIAAENNKISGYAYTFDLASGGVSSNCVLLRNETLPHEADGSSAIGEIDTDGDFVNTRFFKSGIVVNTSTDQRITLRAEYVQYFPGAAVTLNGLLGYNSFRTGQTIHVEFDGNVTLTHNASNLNLKGGINVTPPANAKMTFVCYVLNRLMEVNRTF